MHESIFIEISKDNLFKTCQEMINEKNRLIIINGYVDKEKKPIVSYSFLKRNELISYYIRGENEIPSVTPIYKDLATWCEEEIEEVMPVKFNGLNRGGRLFLPEEFEGKGEILILPLEELKNM